MRRADLTLAIAVAGLAVAGCHLLVHPNELLRDGGVAAGLDAGLEAGLDASDPNPPDADLPDLFPDAGPRTVLDGGVYRMSSGNVSVVFDCQSAGCASTEVRIAGEGSGSNLLYTSTDGSPERFGGISYFAYSFSYESAATDFRVLESGPVSQVFFWWRAADFRGTSLYTLHPDGRLVRDEHVWPTKEHSDAWLVAYFAADATKFTDIEWKLGTASPGMSQVPADTDVFEPVHTAGYTCAFSRSGSPTKDVVGWIHGDELSQDVRLRLRAVGRPDSLLFATDWVEEGLPQPAAIGQEYQATVVAVFRAGVGCSAVAAQAAAWAAPPTWSFSAGAAASPGDANGFERAAGLYRFEAVGSPGPRVEATLGGTELPTSTYRVSGGLAHEVPQVLVDSTQLGASDFVTASCADGEDVFVHVAKPIQPGQKLTIAW